jgi:hypothetical protein
MKRTAGEGHPGSPPDDPEGAPYFSSSSGNRPPLLNPYRAGLLAPQGNEAMLRHPLLGPVQRLGSRVGLVVELGLGEGHQLVKITSTQGAFSGTYISPYSMVLVTECSLITLSILGRNG